MILNSRLGPPSRGVVRVSESEVPKGAATQWKRELFWRSQGSKGRAPQNGRSVATRRTSFGIWDWCGDLQLFLRGCFGSTFQVRRTPWNSPRSTETLQGAITPSKMWWVEKATWWHWKMDHRNQMKSAIFLAINLHSVREFSIAVFDYQRVTPNKIREVKNGHVFWIRLCYFGGWVFDKPMDHALKCAAGL